jgi:hypothetical protein
VHDEPNIGELLGRIAQDARILARDEVALAKLELLQTLQRSSVSVAGILLGGVLALISLGLLCVTVVAALSPVIPALWLRLLIMSAAYLCLGGLVTGTFVVHLRQMPLGMPAAEKEAKQTVSALANELRHD